MVPSENMATSLVKIRRQQRHRILPKDAKNELERGRRRKDRYQLQASYPHSAEKGLVTTTKCPLNAYYVRSAPYIVDGGYSFNYWAHPAMASFPRAPFRIARAQPQADFRVGCVPTATRNFHGRRRRLPAAAAQICAFSNPSYFGQGGYSFIGQIRMARCVSRY